MWWWFSLLTTCFCTKVFVFLFKLLRYVLETSTPSVQELLEKPPDEKPNIAKGVNNFVFFRFKHLPPKEWQMMWVSKSPSTWWASFQLLSITLRFDLANMLIHFINHWNLETPTSLNQQTTAEDVSAYKVLKFRLVLMWSSNCCRQTTQDGWRIATFPPSVTPSLTMTPPSYLADHFSHPSLRWMIRCSYFHPHNCLPSL